MFRQGEAVITGEEEEEAGKVMSGDDFHIREVLKRGRFYNILAAAATVFPAACWTLSPNMKSHIHLKPVSVRSLRTSFNLGVTSSETASELTAVLPGLQHQSSSGEVAAVHHLPCADQGPLCEDE